MTRQHRKSQNRLKQRFLVLSVMMLCRAVFAPAVTIQIDNVPRQQMTWGMDYERLWFWTSGLNKPLCAQLSVADCDLDYIRVAINCGYELEEGVYDPSAYDKILDMMTHMKNADPDIKLFASPRPLDQALPGAPWCPYPLWINVYTQNPDQSWTFVEFKWQKCAEYLVRYVNFMKDHGFKIDSLDITNEWNKVTPTYAKNIRDYMAAQLGEDMPLIVAPSAWSFTQGVNWLNDAISQNALDGFDIAACHNTGSQGTPADFANKAFSIGKVVWDSEVHGWKGQTPAEEIPTSYEMFDRIRAGFSGLDAWLTLGTPTQQHCYILNQGGTPTPNVKYYIFKKLANTSNYGHALDINVPAEFASTAALIHNNQMTVWVLNNSAVTQAGVDFIIEGRTIVSPIEQTQWHPSLPITGAVSVFTKTSDHQFQATIDAETLYCFSFMVNDITLPDGWQSQDIGDVATWGTSGYSDDIFRLDASGSDIWGTADEFHFACTPLSGNGQIKARIASQTNTNPWAKAGVMIRETLKTDSAHAMMILSPGNGPAFQRRTITGGTSTSTSQGSGAAAPYWVKLVRCDDLLTGYTSPDGLRWTQVGSEVIGMVDTVWMGLCVTSHDDGVISTAEFDSVEAMDTLTADIDQDSQIDLPDLAKMSSYWQSENCYVDDWCQKTDLNLDNTVGLTDLALFTEKWLSHTDLTAPLPDPMTWGLIPTALNPMSIKMTATTASDFSGVEYLFECTSGGGHDSGWQDSPIYTDTGLLPGSFYAYRVMTRDKSMHQNPTGWSSEQSESTYTDQWPYLGIFELPCRIESEDYDQGGPEIAYHDFSSGNSGLQYRSDDVDIQSAADIGGGYAVWTGDGEWLEYTVTVPAGGYYAVDVRAASAAAEQTLNLLLDGQLIKAVPIPNTGDSFNWQTTTIEGIYLSAGARNILRVEFPGGGYNLNWIEFRYLSNQWPYEGSPAVAPCRIEAENFDLGGSNIAYWDSSEGNSGLQYRLDEDVDIQSITGDSGYAVWTGNNEWLEYTLSNTEGTFAVEFRVSSMFSGKTIELYLDTQLEGTVQVPNTGSNSVWQTVTLNNLNVSGTENHILRVKFPTGGFNLNWIELRE